MSSSFGKAPRERRLTSVSARLRAVSVRPLDPEDPEVLRLAAAGDDAAVRVLYRSHVDRVHRHVARILGRHDPEVEDVVQRVFLAALDGAASFRGSSKLSTWLLGIASRRALDEARSRWRRDRWQRLGERVGLGSSVPRPDQAIDARGEAESLLMALNPDQRTVFVLKEVEGHTLQEISNMTGVGISTLHARLGAARKRLDEELAARGASSSEVTLA